MKNPDTIIATSLYGDCVQCVADGLSDLINIDAYHPLT